MDNTISNAVLKLENMLKDAYSLGLSEGNKEKYQSPNMIMSFKNSFANACLLSDMAKWELNIVEQFECNSIDDFDKEYKKTVGETRQTVLNPKETQKYKNFSSEIDSMISVASASISAGPSLMTTLADDMEVEEQNVLELIDPVSKTQILNPVKNIKCNHVYEETVIREAIKMNKRTRCPYLGCNNTQPIKSDDLVTDNELRRKIDTARTQQIEKEKEMTDVYEDSD